MRLPQRLIAATVLVALSSALTGCGSMGNFDPSDLLDWLDTKKKLPGERKPVFPDGVPGLEQGVPKSLYKGASQQEIDQQNAQAAAAAAAQPAQDAKSKRTAKSKSKQPTTASTEPAAVPEEDATPAAPEAPKPKKIVRQRTTAPPPDDQQPAAAQPTQQSAAPFPAPLPGGSFQR